MESMHEVKEKIKAAVHLTKVKQGKASQTSGNNSQLSLKKNRKELN